MIIDCYTFFWDDTTATGMTGSSGHPLAPHQNLADLHASRNLHLASTNPVDKTIVHGFQSEFLKIQISNESVADYVSTNPDKIIGFAGIDPSHTKRALEELKRAKNEFQLTGINVAPASQDFHPTNSQAMRIYSEAANLELPILFHHGPQIKQNAKLEYAHPFLLDEVARELPGHTIIVSQMGYPWEQELFMLLAKHDHVYAECSYIFSNPMHAYTILSKAYHAGVISKVLFGSGFPYFHAPSVLDSLFSINQMATGTNLPAIPRDWLRSIITDNPLHALKIDPTISPTEKAVGSTDDIEIKSTLKNGLISSMSDEQNIKN